MNEFANSAGGLYETERKGAPIQGGGEVKTPSVYDTVAGEKIGGRKDRQDFTAKSAVLDMVLTDTSKHPKELPDWMRYLGVSREQLSAVVDHKNTHRDFHGNLRLILDGMGGHGGGEEAAVNGSMFMLYFYHLYRMQGHEEKDSLRRAIGQTNDLLSNRRSLFSDRPNIGQATFVSALETKNGFDISWAGDSQARLFQNGAEKWETPRDREVDEYYRRTRKPIEESLLRNMWGSNRVSSGLGSGPIPHLGEAHVAPLQAGQVLILHSDGMDLLTGQIEQVIKQSGGKGARSILDRLLNESSQKDNVSCRVLMLGKKGKVEEATKAHSTSLATRFRSAMERFLANKNPGNAPASPQPKETSPARNKVPLPKPAERPVAAARPVSVKREAVPPLVQPKREATRPLAATVSTEPQPSLIERMRQQNAFRDAEHAFPDTNSQFTGQGFVLDLGREKRPIPREVIEESYRGWVATEGQIRHERGGGYLNTVLVPATFDGKYWCYTSLFIPQVEEYLGLRSVRRR